LLTNHKIPDVIGIANTCVDPRLYQLEPAGTRIRLVNLSLNELAPAVINGDSAATLLDVPDALVALEKWTGLIKILGPISKPQVMACGFAKTSPELREAFNVFFERCKAEGTYDRMVRKYYPLAFTYFPEFFSRQDTGITQGSSKSVN
jgi:ABC-type amino acid transport substrate-binding protein